MPPGPEAVPGATNADAKNATALESKSFYKAREPIHPKAVRGKFRTIKWAFTIFGLAVYFGLPWLRIDRGPGLPDQAWLIDFAHQRLYLFCLEIGHRNSTTSPACWFCRRSDSS